MKYKNAHSFRVAIEERISKMSKDLGFDIQRIRRDIAFDRLLVRLFDDPAPPWALKGGYAMQLRTQSARTTKDVDLTIEDSKLELRDTLILHASKNIGDYFSFTVSEAVQELDGAPEGGARFLIEAFLADRSFQKFHLDAGLGDIWNAPLDELESSDFLNFAGFKTRKFPAISKEQQFAEKLHAYTLPRPADRPNSRVKDLVDMNLLINDGLENEKVLRSLAQTFSRRGTHILPDSIQPPPANWTAVFESMALECGLDPDVRNGFNELDVYLRKLPNEN